MYLGDIPDVDITNLRAWGTRVQAPAEARLEPSVPLDHEALRRDLWETAAIQPFPGGRSGRPGVGRSGSAGPAWAAAASKRWESADKPGSVEDNHPSGTHVAVRLERPTRKPLRAAGTSPKARALPYLVLLQVGFAVPPNVATGAVRSYRTLSPLPAGRSRHRRFTFCCTVRGLAPPRHYLAPCPMEPGLSSTSLDAAIAWPTPMGSIRCPRRVIPRVSAAPARARVRKAPCGCAP